MVRRLPWLVPATALALLAAPAALSAQALAPAPQAEDTSHTRIVLAVRPAGGYVINNQPVEAAALAGQLEAIFAGRPHKVLLVWHADGTPAGLPRLATEARRLGVTLYRTAELPFTL